MGKKINAQSHSDSEYIRAVYKISEIVFMRAFRPWLYPDFIFGLTATGKEHNKYLSILHGFTNDVIRVRKLEHAERKKIEERSRIYGDSDSDTAPKKRKLALLDLLIEASDDGKVLSDEDIRAEVDTFMFEGHDTTAMSLSWTIFLLGSSSFHQKRVHEELDEIFGSEDRSVTSEDLTKMKYLEMCIKEALRLYPSVPMVLRKFQPELKEFAGVSMKTNNGTLMVYPYVIHRDKEVFPNPEVFDPERFLPSNSQDRNPYAYIPFSAGPRNCIGQRFALMEEKVILSTFFRKFSVTAIDRREDIQLLGDIILRPKNGLHIKISHRNVSKDILGERKLIRL